MSAVPGSPKLTRCTSKPAALRIFSSTPSAPASAGVTDGQRTRSRAMERASVMPSHTMRARRWASAAHEKFLALRLCERGCIDAHIASRQRIGPEPVGPACSPQAEEKQHRPPATFIAVVKPLDTDGGKAPRVFLTRTGLHFA